MLHLRHIVFVLKPEDHLRKPRSGNTRLLSIFIYMVLVRTHLWKDTREARRACWSSCAIPQVWSARSEPRKVSSGSELSPCLCQSCRQTAVVDDDVTSADRWGGDDVRKSPKRGTEENKDLLASLDTRFQTTARAFFFFLVFKPRQRARRHTYVTSPSTQAWWGCQQNVLPVTNHALY